MSLLQKAFDSFVSDYREKLEKIAAYYGDDFIEMRFIFDTRKEPGTENKRKIELTFETVHKLRSVLEVKIGTREFPPKSIQVKTAAMLRAFKVMGVKHRFEEWTIKPGSLNPLMNQIDLLVEAIPDFYGIDRQTALKAERVESIRDKLISAGLTLEDIDFFQINRPLLPSEPKA